MKTVNSILSEETDKLTKALVKAGLITESFQLLNALEDVTESMYAKDNQLTPENWEWFCKVLIECTSAEKFQILSKETLCKIYSVKHFANIDLAIPEDITEQLKFEIKKYFPQLRVDTVSEFVKALQDVPFEFLSLLVLYNTNILNKAGKNDLSPSLEEAEDYFRRLIEKKNKFFLNINKVSKGESNQFSIADAQELLDVKAFSDDTPLNVGALEFMIRMLISDKSKQKLYDEFGSKEIEHLRQQCLLHPSYIKFLQDIDEETTQPYFTAEGFQNKERDKSYNQYVVEIFTPELFIPEQKPEAPAPTPAPQAQQPSQEELVNEPDANTEQTPPPAA